MNIFFGFAPYIAFFLSMQVVSVNAGLWAALTVAVLNAGRDWVRSGSLKVLELGTVFLFCGAGKFHICGTLGVDSDGSAASSGCRPIDNRLNFAGLRTALHFAVRQGEGPRTILACTPLSDHQSSDHLGMGWCLRNASRGTCCRRLRACGAMVVRYRGYNLRARSGGQFHREVSGARAQKGGDCRGLRAQSRLTPSVTSFGAIL